MNSGPEGERPPVRFVKAVKALGVVPRVIITTSHRPSRRTRTFIRDLTNSIEGAVRLTRGHMSLEDLAVLAGEYGIRSVVVVGERKGNPGLLIGYAVSSRSLKEVVRLKVIGVSLSKELKLRSKALCRFVVPAPNSSRLAAEVASYLSAILGLQVTENPTADYLEVRDESAIVVVPKVYPEGRPAPPIFRVVLVGGHQA